VEVDVVDPETSQRRLARLANVRRVAPQGALTVPAEQDAELRRELDLIAAAADRAPDELLVGVRPIGVRGVQEGDPEVEGAVDGRDRGGVVALLPGPVEGAHAHAAKALGADLEPGGAEPSGGDAHAVSSR